MDTMKTLLISAALGGLCAGPLLMTSADVEAKDRKTYQESAEHARNRVSKQREVSGTVLDMKSVTFRGTDQVNTVALIRTKKNDRRLAIDLGPKAQLGGLKLKKGQTLAAEGVVMRVGDQQVLVADRVKQGDTSMKIDRLKQIKTLRDAHSKTNMKGKESPSDSQNRK